MELFDKILKKKINNDIDEADIKRDGTERLMELRLLELVDTYRKNSFNLLITRIITSLILAIVGIIVILSRDSILCIIGFSLLIGAGYIWFSK